MQPYFLTVDQILPSCLLLRRPNPQSLELLHKLFQHDNLTNTQAASVPSLPRSATTASGGFSAITQATVLPGATLHASFLRSITARTQDKSN
jgi:hypothetical protein